MGGGYLTCVAIYALSSCMDIGYYFNVSLVTNKLQIIVVYRFDHYIFNVSQDSD